MKKLIAVILFLAALSTAKAGLIFTVNGEPQPDEITLRTSETIELGLEIAEDHSVMAYQIDYELTSAQAEFIFDNVEFPAPFDLPGKLTGGPQKIQITAAHLSGQATHGPAVLMRGLILHCLHATPVTLAIDTHPQGTFVDWETYEVGHILHIIQIPEPMAILLLATGALILRRRR